MPDRRNIEKLSKKMIAYLIAISSVFIFLPHIFRFLSGNNAIPGIISYEHLEISTYKTPNLFYFLISLFPSDKSAAFFIPVIVSILSVVIFIALLRELRIGKKKTFIATLLLAASPVFSYSSFILSPFSLVLLINLVVFWLLIKQKRSLAVIACIISLSTAFIGLIPALCTSIMLLAYFLSKRDEKLLVIASLAVLTLALFINHPQTSQVISPLSQSFSDFGAMIGFGLFEFILGLIGIFLSWDKKQRLVFAYIATFIFISLSLFVDSEVKILLVPFFAAFIADLFVKLDARRWQVPSLKKMSLILLACSLLFSSISYSNRISDIDPNNEIIESLEWLKDNSKPEHKVFSEETNYPLIVYISERDFAIPINNDTETIYHSRNLKATSSILDDYNITHIWIDQDMKNEVWIGEDEGILFLFSNNETFKKVFSNNKTEIWRFYSNLRKIN